MAQRRSPSEPTWQTRPRRRAIEAALRRRPDIDVDSLHGVLRRLGFDVPLATLLSDLDALGYDVDEAVATEPAAAELEPEAEAEALEPEPEPEPEAVAVEMEPVAVEPEPEPEPEVVEPEAAPGASRSAMPVPEIVVPAVEDPTGPSFLPPPAPDPLDDGRAERAQAPEVEDAFADPSPRPGRGDGDAAGPRERLRRLAPLLVLVALLTVVVAAAVALPPDDAPEEVADPTTEPRSTTTEAGTVPAPADRHDPELSNPDALDVHVTFDGDASSLPAVEGLEPWTTVGADWFTQGGAGRAGMTDAPRAVAFLGAPTPDLRAEVTLPDGTSGTGIAFRVAGESSYLAWVVAPRFYTANLYRVTDGRARLVLNSGVTAVPPGVRVGVHAVDRLVELLVDGSVVATFDDVWTPDATGVGLVAMEPAEAPVFDDLRIRYEPA